MRFVISLIFYAFANVAQLLLFFFVGMKDITLWGVLSVGWQLVLVFGMLKINGISFSAPQDDAKEVPDATQDARDDETAGAASHSGDTTFNS